MFEFLRIALEFIANVFTMFFNLKFHGNITYGHILIFLIFLALIIWFFISRKGSDK